MSQNPVKWLDEQVLREYTKIAKKWEDKGRSIKTLTIPLNLISLAILSGHSAFTNAIYGGIYGFVNGSDMSRNLFEQEKNETSSTIAKDNPLISIYKDLHKFLRLPIFATGIAMIATGSIELYNYLANNDTQLNESFRHFKTGLSLLLLSSSMYLKDRDPKLLDKQPAWQKAYSWIKEKLSSLIPQPAMQSVPIQSYSTLENYIQD